jgi:hypothetical protein
MPAALCLIFIAAPIIAALSLDSDTFVTFLILYCVTAGLCTSSADTPTDSPIQSRSEENRRSCEPRIDPRCEQPTRPSRIPSAPDSVNAPRSLELSRF